VPRVELTRESDERVVGDPAAEVPVGGSALRRLLQAPPDLPGLVLDVLPTVSHDRKYVTMQLKPTIATLTRPIPTFTTSLGAFTTPVTIQIPELKVQRAATTVRVPDGGTVLLGGLKNINLADLKSGTPWISSVPFASFFLGRRASAKEMDNLMVICTATITDLREQEDKFRK